MIFEAWADESGTHQSAPVIVVAGLVALAECWREFEKKWGEATERWELPHANKEDLTSPRYFHMKEFVAGQWLEPQGFYKDWGRARSRARLRYLLRLIRLHTLFSFGVGFARADFEAAMSQRAKQYLGGPYGFAAIQCMKVVASGWYSPPHRYDCRVAWFFEDRTQGKAEILGCWERHKDEAAWRLASTPVFVDKGKYAVQAADIVAWELNKELRIHLKFETRGHDRLDFMGYPDRRKSLKRLRFVPNQWHLFTPDGLRRVGLEVDAQIDAENNDLAR